MKEILVILRWFLNTRANKMVALQSPAHLLRNTTNNILHLHIFCSSEHSTAQLHHSAAHKAAASCDQLKLSTVVGMKGQLGPGRRSNRLSEKGQSSIRLEPRRRVEGSRGHSHQRLNCITLLRDKTTNKAEATGFLTLCYISGAIVLQFFKKSSTVVFLDQAKEN